MVPTTQTTRSPSPQPKPNNLKEHLTHFVKLLCKLNHSWRWSTYRAETCSCIPTVLTYLLTWCRVLLEKLTGLQLVKKFPAFHGTRKFITALTSFRHLSLSRASPIQSIYPHPTAWRSILILSTHLRLGFPSGLLPSGFPTKTLYTPSPHPYVPHAQPISFFSILSPTQYWVRSTNHLAPRYAISSIPPLPRPPRSKYSPQHHVLKHPQLPFLPQCQRPSFTSIQNNRLNYSSICLDL